MADFIFINHYDEFSKELDDRIEAALEACGIQAEGYAQDIVEAGVPRHANSWYTSKGGAGLRGSISHKVEMSEETVYIGTNNEHAIYNEYGTGIFLESDDGRSGRQTPWHYQDDEGNWHRTSGMKALHFLKNALANHIKEYKEILIQQLSK